MRLDVTPIVITFDEEANLERVLARLHWAREVLVVDSGSTDATLAIARASPNVRVVSHPFAGFAAQWRFALEDAGVTSAWVLTLDADYVLDDTLLAAIAALPADPPVAAYRAAFTYCVHGRALRGSLYPPRAVLLRRDRVRFEQVGHMQAERVDGPVGMLPGRILHDDRKPVQRWLASQWRYAREEAALIARTPFAALSWGRRARKLIVPAPVLAAAVALLWRGGLLDGRAGLHYALERMVAEALIGLALVRRALGIDDG